MPGSLFTSAAHLRPRWRATCAIAALLLAVMVGAAVKLQWVLTPKHAYVVLPAITLTEGEGSFTRLRQT